MRAGGRVPRRAPFGWAGWPRIDEDQAFGRGEGNPRPGRNEKVSRILEVSGSRISVILHAPGRGEGANTVSFWKDTTAGGLSGVKGWKG